MKTNYKLKIICLMCLLTAALGSCKKNEVGEDQGLTGNHNNLAIAGDGKWDLLGHGYDITGELFERKNTSKVSIIDIDAFYRNYPTRIPTPTDTKGGYRVFYGATAYDYVKDVNDNKVFGATASYGDSKPSTEPANNKLYATANFSLTNTNHNIFTYGSKYSYATYESWYRIKSIDFTDDVSVEVLKNYLTPEFITNISNFSAEQIIETYKTHVMLGIDLGGRLKYDYKGAVVKESTYDRKLRAIKAGFSIGIAKLFSIDLSSDVSKEEKTTISTETTDKLFSGTFYGGNNSGTSFSGDALGNTSTNINLISWQQSINVNNASLIGINKSVPIYEFITDPVKKQQVKDAVEKYISDRQIIMTTQDYTPFPVGVYYSQGLNVWRYEFNIDNIPYLRDGSWQYKQVYFSAFKEQAPGTVPVYEYWAPTTNDCVWDKSRSVSNDPYWQFGGIKFYAYSTQQPGTIPIYRYYHHRSRRSHFLGTDAGLPYPQNEWTNEGVVFYAYPAR